MAMSRAAASPACRDKRWRPKLVLIAEPPSSSPSPGLLAPVLLGWL